MPTIQISGGCEIYYEDQDFADSWVPHDTVLMQPHLSGDADEYRAWVPTLSRHYRVIRVDRRGLGRSGIPPLDYEFTLDKISADTVEILDSLYLGRVHYIGTSGSGIMGIHFAAHHPDRLLSLTAIGTPSRIPVQVKTRFLREGFTDAASAVTALGTWLYYHTAPPLYTSKIPLFNDWFTERLSRIPAHVLASLYRMAGGFDVTDLLPKISVPTLLISAAEGQFAQAEQEKMAAAITQCERYIVKGASGNIAWDNPDECARATLAFLQKISGRTAA
jgi:pimeloyl-ACP methyl ester carboxylesterase